VFDARRERLKSKGINGNGAGRLLAVEVRRSWPTPAASDNRDRSGPSAPNVQRRIRIGKQVSLSMSVEGRLNPSWVEALQGFPPGWTALTDGPPLQDHSTPGNRRAPDHDSLTTGSD